MVKSSKIYTLILFLLSSINIFSADLYVATNGTGNGSSWENATNDLQDAIDICQSNYTIWVSNGLYDVQELIIGTNIIVRSKDNDSSTVVINGMGTGRAIFMYTNSWIIGITISNGFASEGGGVINGFVSNCIITHNILSDIGNTMGAGAKNCIIYNSIIKDNNASAAVGKGGGAYACTIYSSIISNNTAGTYSGGGASESTVYNSIVCNNTAGSGGGLRDTTAYNTLIINNTANGVFAAGGGLCCTFYNCTITDNGVDGTKYCNLYNSISYNNGSYDIQHDPGTTPCGTGTNYYSCGDFRMEDEFGDFIPCLGLGSINQNPSFTNSGNYRLLANSPCINTGSNTYTITNTIPYDLDNNLRIWNSLVDMGVYEYGSQQTEPIPIILTNVTYFIIKASIDSNNLRVNGISLNNFKGRNP